MSVIVALVVPDHEHRDAACALLEEDDDWRAPLLWRSEVCDVLATLQRNGVIHEDEALEALELAELAMQDGAYEIVASVALRTAMASGCAGYDAELVVLARDLHTELLTNDRALLERFPDLAVNPEEHLAGDAA
jgi:predicted nucleic acid-binding protein